MSKQQRLNNLILKCEKMIDDLSVSISSGESRVAELKRIKAETETRLNSLRAMLEVESKWPERQGGDN